MGNWRFRTACRYLVEGGVIAYPTEAVYGLGCFPWDYRAVARILAMKRRAPGKGLIVVAADIRQLTPFLDSEADLPMDEIQASWPGPVTWVLPAHRDVPTWLRGTLGGIAVRVSAHPPVQHLCRVSGPLVSTSANPEGCTPARNPNRVRSYFGRDVDFILYAPLGNQSNPTEIRDAVSGRLIRNSSPSA